MARKAGESLSSWLDTCGVYTNARWGVRIRKYTEKKMDAVGLVEQAYTAKKIGPRQYKALSKHAAHHTPEHIALMLDLMEHKTMRQAHQAALVQEREKITKA